MLVTRNLRFSLSALALFGLLAAGSAQADILSSPGGSKANGTATGTITAVTYDSNGNLSSAEFTDSNGSTYEITNGRIDNDISDFGTKLEKAFDNDNEVTITSDFGDMTGLTRKKKKVDRTEQEEPQQVPQ